MSNVLTPQTLVYDLKTASDALAAARKDRDAALAILNDVPTGACQAEFARAGVAKRAGQTWPNG